MRNELEGGRMMEVGEDSGAVSEHAASLTLPADYDRVLRRVAKKVARENRGLVGVEREDFKQQAYLLCYESSERNPYTRATSVGAFSRFLEDRLRDWIETERSRSRITTRGVIELVTDGEGERQSIIVDTDNPRMPVEELVSWNLWRRSSVSAYLVGEEDEDSPVLLKDAPVVRAGSDSHVNQCAGSRAEDGRPKYVPGQRSRLFDRLQEGAASFLTWAQGQGLTPAKLRELDVLFNGDRREVDALYRRYVQGKRIGGTTSAEDREHRMEEWAARYRFEGDPRTTLIRRGVPVLNVDAGTVGLLYALRGRTWTPGVGMVERFRRKVVEPRLQGDLRALPVE